MTAYSGARRAFIFGLGLLIAGGARAAAPDPQATIEAIYRKAVKDAGPNWIQGRDRTKDMTKSLAALWAKADAKTPKGDEGPIDFDLVSDTNGLTLSGYNLKLEKSDDKSAVVAATIVYREGDPNGEARVVRYDLTREDGRWKIDEIRGKDWSLRAILNAALK